MWFGKKGLCETFVKRAIRFSRTFEQIEKGMEILARMTREMLD